MPPEHAADAPHTLTHDLGSPVAPEALASGGAAQLTRLVWNPFLGTYVAQAPARMQRREGSSECAFCQDVATGRVAAGTQTWIRPNDFPALRPPAGECYLIIYSPQHDRPFARMSVAEVERIIGTWQEVYSQLAPRYPCVMTWETSGASIGQTQPHPHGQTYGISIVPDILAREMRTVEEAERKGLECPFCAELARESGGERQVLSGEYWVGYVPSYARYPYQVHLAPRRHLPNVAALREPAAVRELAADLLRLVRAYNRVFEAPMPYMLALHQLADERFHFHLDLLPVGRAPGKLKQPAGIELSFGVWLNDSVPESTAARLREALDGDDLTTSPASEDQ